MTNLNDKAIWDAMEELIADGVAETDPPGQPRDAWNEETAFRLTAAGVAVAECEGSVN